MCKEGRVVNKITMHQIAVIFKYDMFSYELLLIHVEEKKSKYFRLKICIYFYSYIQSYFLGE